MKNTHFKKLLSMVLSLVMVLSVVGVALPQLAPTASAATVSDAQWERLINALKSDNVKNAKFTQGTNTNTAASVTADDPSGDLLEAAEAYYDVLNTYKVYQTSTSTNNSASTASLDTITASKINNYVKSQLTTRMGAADYSNYNVDTVLTGFNANYTNSRLTSNDYGTSSPGDVTLTVTITNSGAVLGYDSLAVLPENVPSKVVYTYKHTSTLYTTSSGSGCSATTTNHYYARFSSNGVSRTASNTSTKLIKDLETAVANSEYFNAPFADLLEVDTEVLKAAKTALSDPYNALLKATAYDGEAAYKHYFKDAGTDVVAVIDDIEAALAIVEYVEIAKRLQADTEVDVPALAWEDLSTLYFDMKADLEDYNSAPLTARSYLQENGYIGIDAVDAKFDEVRTAYELYYLENILNPRIEADLELYTTYTDDWTLTTDGVEGILAAAELELNSVIDDLNSRLLKNVVAVFGEDYIANTIQPVLDGFARIREVNGYNLTFKAYQDVYNSVFNPLTLDETAADLLNILLRRDKWYTDLLAFVDELKAYDADLAEKILTDAEAAMELKINQTYDALNAILETQINDAWALYQVQLEQYGLKVTEVNLASYNTLLSSIGLIDINVYNFLEGTVHFELSEEAVAKYEELKNLRVALDNYDPSLHLSTYKYNAETLDPIVRLVNEEKDIIRDRDYVVTDDDFSKLIDILQSLLTDGGLSDLGVDLDLAATIDGLQDTVYTDKFLNTLVGAVYPMLIGVMKDYLGEYTSYLSLANTTADEAFSKVGVAVVPTYLATLIRSYNSTAYSSVVTLLNRATGGMMDDVSPWDNAALWRDVVDENGEVVRDDENNPKKELVFDWGIDAAGAALEEAGNIDAARAARKAKFLDAANAALKGLEPALLAMLTSKAIPKTQIAYRSIILVGSATVYINSGANDGYNNALAPIFEALGLTVADGKTFKDSKDIIELGIINPVHELLGKLKSAPLDTILDLLPNLAFAIQNGLFLPLLHNILLHLNLDIQLSGLASGFSGCIPDVTEFDIDLGDPGTLNLADILKVPTLYDDITSLDGVLNLVLGLLAPAEEVEEGEEPAPALTLPEIDGAKLAMLGTDVTWADSFRSVSQIKYEGRTNVHANIKANRPQVMQFLVEYILEALKDENFLPAIMNLLAKDDEAEEGEEPAEPVEGEEGEAAPDILNTILDNISASGTDAIAALVELMRPVYRYTMPDKIEWIKEGNIGATDYAENWTDEDADGNRTLWTKAKAVYLAEHLEDFLNDVVVIFGEQLGGAQTLGEAVDYLLANLFKAETVNGLVDTIRDLLGGIELPEAIADLGLLEQLGLDLTAWDDMSFDFADGDKNGFKNALIELLNPLASVLRFILAKEDISLTLLDKITVTAVGYDGYSYGIVPLLEALGATGVKTTTAFISDKANIVKNIVDPLFTVIDNLQKNPVVFLEDIIPSLLYFAKVDGIQVAIQHLLTSVNVLLDTVRPIYDLNIYQLANEQLGIDLRSAETDFINFIFIEIDKLIEENTEIRFGFDFTVDNLTETLHFTDPELFTSKNGDPAYTIHLTTEGKADLLSNILNYGINEIIFGENYEKLSALLLDLISDEDTRALVKTILDIVKDADEDYANGVNASVDHHGIHDVALASIFWLLFGADSVTDAVSDFFYRYKDANFWEILWLITDKAPDYVERVRFLYEEALNVEYPEALELLSNYEEYLKPPYEYDEHETKVVSGFLGRILAFFTQIFVFLRNLFSR